MAKIVNQKTIGFGNLLKETENKVKSPKVFEMRNISSTKKGTYAP